MVLQRGVSGQWLYGFLIFALRQTQRKHRLYRFGIQNLLRPQLELIGGRLINFTATNRALGQSVW